MKKILSILVLGLMVSLSDTCHAVEKNTAQTIEQKDVIKLIKELYKVKPESFEAGEFDGQGYSMKKQGEMLARFFYKQSIKKRKDDITKKDNGYEVPFRYPQIPEPGDVLEVNSSGSLPHIKILTPEIDNDRAKAVVKINDNSLCHYFLKKLPEGWRIYKIRSFSYPPNNLYFLSHEDHMEEYPSGNQFWNDKIDMNLSEW
ncbi:MAG: hypothetical protein Q7R66_00675 [Undibacterium sp.]|uniref:hypothetical protein n=1 Tax=Undibacterium sp. TaxID=1914977 RepID=UPI00271FFC60|nr:hypothetical protein [Undibacterium sp.]MDO8650691.1 hypothetical protein [Undibacterium sp.]